MADPPPARAGARRSGRPGFWTLSSAFVLAGVAFRYIQFHAARSLWLDESMLALNIAARSFRELLRPLDYNQVAPPLYLWLSRLAVLAAGTNEQAMRAWPMAAGMALLPLLGLVGYRLLGSAGALAALGLAALSPTLVWYANEAKPYGSDAFVTVALLAATVAVREQPSPRRWLALLAGGTAGMLLSIPAAFVGPATLAALALDAPLTAARLRWLAGCAAAWAATLALVYVAVYAPAARSPHQQDGYEQAFLFPGPGFGSRVVLALGGTIGPTFAGGGSTTPPLSPFARTVAVAVLALGLVFIARRAGRASAVLVSLPLALAVVASALRRYPLGVPRMMVFAAPLLILMASGAVAWVALVLAAHARASLLAAAGVLCLAPSMRSRLVEARAPAEGENGRALVAVYRDRPVRQEPVYVAARGIPSWVFYTTNWESPDRRRLAFYAHAASNGPSFENAPSRPRPAGKEGLDLVYSFRGHDEILGLASGRQWRWPSYVRPNVDEWWPAHEAKRIVRAANPCAWLYFTHLSERATRPITWHLREKHRGKVEVLVPVAGGVLYRYCFPRTPQQLEDLASWKAELAAREPSPP